MVIVCSMLFISLSFDGGTVAYEDKLMAKHHVGPFDLMFRINLYFVAEKSRIVEATMLRLQTPQQISICILLLICFGHSTI